MNSGIDPESIHVPPRRVTRVVGYTVVGLALVGIALLLTLVFFSMVMGWTEAERQRAEMWEAERQRIKQLRELEERQRVSHQPRQLE